MREGKAFGPEAIRTAKLYRYLLEGNTVVVGGIKYVFKSESQGAIDAMSVAVNHFLPGEMIELALALEGAEYTNVMNYRSRNGRK